MTFALREMEKRCNGSGSAAGKRTAATALITRNTPTMVVRHSFWRRIDVQPSYAEQHVA